MLQISLLQPTEQLSVTADFRALLRQAKLKWFNMQEKKKKKNYMHLSLLFCATFSLYFGVLGVAMYLSGALFCFFNFFGLNCRSADNPKLLGRLCQNLGLAVRPARIRGFAGSDSDPSDLLDSLWLPVSAGVKNCVLT